MRGLVIAVVVGLLLAAPMLWRMGQQVDTPTIQVVLPSVDTRSRSQPGDIGVEAEGDIQLLFAVPVSEGAGDAALDPLMVVPVAVELTEAQRDLLAISASHSRPAERR